MKSRTKTDLKINDSVRISGQFLIYFYKLIVCLLNAIFAQEFCRYLFFRITKKEQTYGNINPQDKA